MKMLLSHVVVTRHIPNEADNVPKFFFSGCSSLRRKQMDFFLLNAYIHKSTLII